MTVALAEAPALRAPFPYPGGKRRIADAVWRALGDVRVYVEPFFGSGAVLLCRPHAPGIETINDADGLLCNVWRAVQADPAGVARHADYPVSEIDLHARHRELVTRAGEVRAKLEADPRWCDAELAGWWVWGASQWIGGGWCVERDRVRRQRPAAMGHGGRGVHQSRPMVAGSNAGKGVHRPPQRRPNLTTAGSGVQRPSQMSTWASRPYLGDSSRGVHALRVRLQMPNCHGLGGSGVAGHRVEGIEGWLQALAARLRRVRVVCGDFARVLSPSCLYTEGANVAGVFLDPPYAHHLRDGELYAHDDGEASARARAWALAHGDDPRLRVVLAGLEGEHAMPARWRVVAWKGAAGLGRVSGNRHRERLWLSSHCQNGDGPLFARADGGP